MKSLVLTAGLGTRFQPFTHVEPKPVLPFLQLPMLAYSSHLLIQGGVDQLVFNLHHLPESIRRTLGESPLAQHIAGYSEEPTLLGSGGGLIKASHFFADQTPWLLANGDEVFLPENPEVLKEFVSSHKSSGSFATLLVQNHPLAGSTFGGVWVNEEGQVHGFGRDAKAFPGCKPWHYLGFLAVEPEIRNYLPREEVESNILYDGLAKAIQAGQDVRISQAGGFWGETGDIQSYLSTTAQVLALLPQNFYLQSLRSEWGKEPCPLDHLPSGASILHGRDSTIESKNLVKSFAVLDDHVVIEGQVSLDGVVIRGPNKISGPLNLRNTLIL